METQKRPWLKEPWGICVGKINNNIETYIVREIYCNIFMLYSCIKHF